MNNLSYKKIFLFWIPLASTWFMMSLEGPYISAIIARLPEPKYNLAAYGVAFAIALIVEAPVIMMMSASTALVKCKESYRKLHNFSNALNILVTVGMLVLLIPPIFDFCAYSLLNLENRVAELTYEAIAILLPWPGMIGIRRFYQGILIRNNQTKKVAYGTIIRLLSMSATAFILYSLKKYDGVIVGTAALSAGVIAEAIASRVMVHKTLTKIKLIDKQEEINYLGITKFYYPLILTSLLSLGVHPFVTFFMGRARMPLESLAVLPVINALVFIFRSVGLSFQEVIIALIGDGFENYKEIKNFSIILGVSVLAMLGFIAFTPLNKLWFGTISGLSDELVEFASTPLKIMTILPALTVLLSFQRSILVASKHTSPITWGTSMEVVGIIITLFILVNWMSYIGVVAAAIAYVVGRFMANGYLLPHIQKAKEMVLKNPSPNER